MKTKHLLERIERLERILANRAKHEQTDNTITVDGEPIQAGQAEHMLKCLKREHPSVYADIYVPF